MVFDKDAECRNQTVNIPPFGNLADEQDIVSADRSLCCNRGIFWRIDGIADDMNILPDPRSAKILGQGRRHRDDMIRPSQLIFGASHDPFGGFAPGTMVKIRAEADDDLATQELIGPQHESRFQPCNMDKIRTHAKRPDQRRDCIERLTFREKRRYRGRP